MNEKILISYIIPAYNAADTLERAVESITHTCNMEKYDIPKDNVFGYAEDTKMKLNSDKLQALGWTPEIGLEDAYKRMIEQMKIEEI